MCLIIIDIFYLTDKDRRMCNMFYVKLTFCGINRYQNSEANDTFLKIAHELHL